MHVNLGEKLQLRLNTFLFIYLNTKNWSQSSVQRKKKKKIIHGAV